MTQVYDEFVKNAESVARTLILMGEITGTNAKFKLDVDGMTVFVSAEIEPVPEIPVEGEPAPVDDE